MNELTWKRQFASKIDELGIPDTWSICFDMNLTNQDKGLIYTQDTFGSFRCSCCARSWNSSKVFLLFLLNQNKWSKNGTVRMRIFKQCCEHCTFNEESPSIRDNNIKRVVCNLVRKIQRKFYDMHNTCEELKPRIYGPLDGPHNSELCEACRYGLCEQTPSIFGRLDSPHSSELCEARRYGLPEQTPSRGQQKMECGGSAMPGLFSALGVGALAVGIGALTLMYLGKKDDPEKKRKN